MKYISRQTNNKDGYGGCLLWILIIAVLIMASCATTKKDGCGTENYKHKFNK